MYNLATDSNKTVVVLINDFHPEYGLALQKLSKKLGRELTGVLLVDKSIKAANTCILDPSGLFTEVVCDFYDPFSIKEAMRSFENSLLLVTCSSERNQPYLKAILPYMPSVFGPTETSIDWATHKYSMREHLESYNDDLTPKYRLLTKDTVSQLDKLVKGLEYPLIVKPNGLAASILVTKVHNEIELIDTVKKTFAVIEKIYSRDKGRGKPSAVIEEFIEGAIYSVDAYVNETGTVWSLPPISVTTAHAVGLEGFYGYRNDTKTDLDASDVEALNNVVEQAIYALGLRSCVAHVELFKTGNGWKVVELGPRAGGYRQELYELAYGIDHAYNEFLVKIGLDPIMQTKELAYAAMFKIYPEEEGRITAIHGLSAATALESVVWIKQQMHIGDVATFSGSGGKFVVDGVLQNKDFNHLTNDMDLIRQTILIEVEQP